MAYQITENKSDAYLQIETLTKVFKSQYASLKQNSYKEAQLRIDYLNPFLKSLGWDVDNEKQKNQFLRDVIQEESIDVLDDNKLTKKNPDYTLRTFGQRKLFIEAKKVIVDVLQSKASAFQTRRYGWSANLGISVLTNFEYLVIYDCRFQPFADDETKICRHQIFHFEEYLEKFDEIYNLLSFEAVSKGGLNTLFPLDIKGGITFDTYFLNQIESWREQLALNIIDNNSGIGKEDINFLIQRLLNRIIFLRICEDRNIEKYETLKSIASYEELKKLFLQSDKKYNSELFNFIEDTLALNINLDDQLLIKIFNELYYPISPYDFAVIDPDILSQIYEKYLGSKIDLKENRTVSIVGEPEVVASNGVVPTPKNIVKQIVVETLNPLFDRIDFQAIQILKIADICCGSGTFLLSVYDYLVEKRVEYLLQQNIEDENRIFQSSPNTWQLSLKEKHAILSQNIFGVDSNPYAVEVARFSLSLKLLENENKATLQHYLRQHQQSVLPALQNNIKCGNSLLDNKYFNFDEQSLENDDLLFQLKPFEWKEEFPFLENTGGFDAIVGNPPYVRIQNLVKYSPQEVAYYRSKQSGYSYTKKDSFDKYYLFIERAIQLLNPVGLIGYIIPHKFFITKGGTKLRKSITTKTFLSKIIHFGVTQVFPERSTYTTILILDKKEKTNFSFQRINSLTIENPFSHFPIIKYKCSNYSASPWVFLSKEAELLFEKIKNQGTTPLKELADITVGLQTSADKIYIFTPVNETKTTIFFEKDGIKWEIEKAITLPCLYDAKLELFDAPNSNARIIFPYFLEDGNAVVYSEQQMQSLFPLCWKYLLAHQTKLEKRSINGKNPVWYQFGRSQSLTKFHNTSKLIFPVLSTQQSYAFDNKNIQFTGGGNGPYYSILSNSEYSIFYILGILAHPAFEAMIKSRASEFRGSYYSHGKQFIENLPIKDLNLDNREDKLQYDSIVKCVQNLIKTRTSIQTIYNSGQKKVLKRKFNFLQEKLITLINTLYDLNSDELEELSENRLFITDNN